MSALDKLMTKDFEETTALEDCILEATKGKTWADHQTAKQAAEQLAAMQTAIDAARQALRKIAKMDGPSFARAFGRCVDVAREALAALERNP